ncbi:pirin family protein [Gynurincola endophyticus]|uniref:pirin family protein n=1 Tax=Gynurincola endophyticus TaxID=2479004 RepID=UPI000F8F4FFA|nr:hypothetical protein [Gynurincola endophyticus]
MIKMFMAEQRGIQEDARQRILSTFNYGEYYHPDKIGVDNLYLLNECSLAKGEDFDLLTVPYTAHIIVPLVGDLIVQKGPIRYGVSIGKIFYSERMVESKWTITSLDPEEPVSFLHIGIKSGIQQQFFERTTVLPIPLSVVKDEWIIPELFKNNPSISFSIGTYNPGKEFSYQSKLNGGLLFAFVLEGAVEMEERILYAGDGICFFDTTAINFEVLSGNSIFCMLEFEKKDVINLR